jgi:hypothetical protein
VKQIDRILIRRLLRRVRKLVDIKIAHKGVHPIIIHAIEGAQFVAERAPKRNDPVSQFIVTRCLNSKSGFHFLGL